MNERQAPTAQDSTATQRPRVRFREAMADLSRAQKAKRGVSLYSRWINRPIGRVLAASLASLGLGPNAVSLLSGAVTAAGLVLVAVRPPVALTGFAAAGLLVLGFALDSADGQVARLTGRSSPAGEWLDHVLDAAKLVAVHLAVLVGLFRAGVEPVTWLGVPLAFAVVSTTMFAGMTIFTFLRRNDGAPRQPSTTRAIGLLPADYGVLALSFVLWGWQPVFLGAYSALFLGTTAITGLLLAKWFRTLSGS